MKRTHQMKPQITLTTFIVTTVGVSTVAMAALVVGFAVGVVTGL